MISWHLAAGMTLAQGVLQQALQGAQCPMPGLVRGMVVEEEEALLQGLPLLL